MEYKSVFGAFEQWEHTGEMNSKIAELIEDNFDTFMKEELGRIQ